MKNIHILPTDKPSKLYLGNNRNFVFGMMQTSIQSKNDDFANQHIYITSDGEITVGYWLDLADNSIIKVTLKDLIKFKSYDKLQFKKIILTTDPDLIKDGVQAIDDEFLEWFVKNPSCESVEIERNFADEGVKGITHYGKYFLIIPIEEPNQETHICKWCKAETWQSDDECYAKQETLEEVAEIDLTKLCYYDKRNPDFQIKEEYGYDKEEVEATGNFAKKDCACDNCFYGRSKLTEQLIRQQERRYSEEEVILLIAESICKFKLGKLHDEEQIIESLEQFKKK